MCYKPEQLSYNFDEAISFCERQSAELATVRSMEEDEALVEIMNKNYINSVWIGIKHFPTLWSSSDGLYLMKINFKTIFIFHEPFPSK